MKFCCHEMSLFINDARDPIFYNPLFREYYIEINDSINIITMSFCPWCGTKLPNVLRNKYFDTLEEEYNLDISISDIKKNPLIPEEFRTDEWWKKRGL